MTNEMTFAIWVAMWETIERQTTIIQAIQARAHGALPTSLQAWADDQYAL